MMHASFRPLLIAGLTMAMGYTGSALAADAPPGTPPQVAARVPQSVVTHRVVTAPYEVTAPAGPRPIFRLFGWPVMLEAPVPPPYAPSAYRDRGGQPESGRDAVMAQSAHAE